jgi:FMN reductase
MAKDSSEIRIVVICGSVRQNNNTSRAVAIVTDELARQNVPCEALDPAEMDLPVPGKRGNPADVARLKEAVVAATGVILATPEYHGSYSSVIKIVIENLGFPSVLARKPVGLLGVASGQIGAVKALEHLRSVCSHVGAIVLPGPVSIAGVQTVFDDDGEIVDAAAEKRIRGLATTILNYIRQHLCPKVALEQIVRSEKLS